MPKKKRSARAATRRIQESRNDLVQDSSTGSDTDWDMKGPEPVKKRANRPPTYSKNSERTQRRKRKQLNDAAKTMGSNVFGNKREKLMHTADKRATRDIKSFFLPLMVHSAYIPTVSFIFSFILISCLNIYML